MGLRAPCVGGTERRRKEIHGPGIRGGVNPLWNEGWWKGGNLVGPPIEIAPEHALGLQTSDGVLRSVAAHTLDGAPRFGRPVGPLSDMGRKAGDKAAQGWHWW